MKKALSYAVLFAVIWFATYMVLQFLIFDSPNWINSAINGSVGGFFGVFNGYRLAKKEKE